MMGGLRGCDIRSWKAKSKDYELGCEADNSTEEGNSKKINPEMGEKS